MPVELDRDKATQALGEEIAQIFLEHAEALTPEEARDLEPLIHVHLEAAYKVRTTMTPAVDVRLAEQCVEACKGLLDAYTSLDENNRAAVTGAVRYFILTSDAQSDLASETGFKDDAMVVNYVIGLTGVDVEPVKME